MEWLVVLGVAALAVVLWVNRPTSGPAVAPSVDLSHLPAQFIVFDLETTGLNPYKHEIIEIGAIRVNRDSDNHDVFTALVKPSRKVPKRITQITGITQAMIDADGEPLDQVLTQFLEFIGDLPLVAFNAEFDMAFLKCVCEPRGRRLGNRVSCALLMARRAFPGRKSYRLSALARDGGLDVGNAHRAVADCQRALIVYTSAANRLRET